MSTMKPRLTSFAPQFLVDDLERSIEQCVTNGVTIIKRIMATEWGTKDFYVEDPDGNIISFGGHPAAG